MAPRDPKTPYGFPPERPAFEPFPASVPWDEPIAGLGWWLVIRCRCGRGAQWPLRLVAARQGWQLTLRELVPRLRCPHADCRRRPERVTLNRDGAGDRGRFGATDLRLDLSAAIGRD